MESSLVVRHADVEIDVRHELVRRGGVPQHLRQKSLRVLFHLIENRDRPVSKQELLSTVWNDVAVTDDTLVQSIVEIRKALGDEARDAQFVRTIPRLGYQFVAPAVEPVVAPEVQPIPPPLPASSTRLRIALAVAIFVVVASSLIGIFFRENTSVAKAAVRPLIVAVMPFEQRSGSAELRWLREGLPAMLVTQLSRSDGFTLVSREQLTRAIEARDAGDRSPLAIARQTRATRLVTGTFAQLGGTIRVDAQLIDATSGRLLAGESIVGSQEVLLSQIDELATSLASRMTARNSASPRLVDAMTDDLEAYRLYLQGVERTESLDNPKAIELFEQAIARDPDFAMAHARIGYAYGVTWGQLERAKPHLERALQLGDRLSEKDRLHVEAWRAIVDRQFPSAIELFRSIIARYPTELEAYLRAGQLLSGEEQLADAASVLERGLAVDSASPGLHNALGQVYLFLGRKDEAIAAHQRYVALAPTEPNAHDSLGITWQAIGEYDKALAEYESALRLNPRFDIARVHLANTYFQMGRRRDAAREFERYIEEAPSDIERARGYSALANIRRSRGDLKGATELAQRAMIFPFIGRDALYLLALDRGDLATARTFQAQMDSKRSGRGARVTMRVTYYLKGYEALKTGQSQKAIEHFQQALRYQPPHYGADTMEDCLANAYLTLGRYTEAVREYERVLRFNPNHALARFHLAQTYSALGRRDDALREYRRFLEIWKNADRDLPEVIEARKVVGRGV
ncbi:MAG TPA: tetratricopeptide repeat protein [Thermoanaerobaculia bacterium]|nr:tetratricopeptide repeat protein [Thermoanaerobaculia bacterium]